MCRMKALAINSLTKTYPNGIRALRGIDLEVEEGDFFALLGPNGAGKTTTIGIITSLVNKTDGDVRVFGHSLDNDVYAAKACIGVVPQEINMNLYESCYDIVMNQAGYYGIPRSQAAVHTEAMLRQLQLWDRRDDQARGLSGGMKRRLMIARALVHSPKLLILDEPTAGVDIEIRRSMWEFLKEINEQGTTIILTTHYLEEAETLCRNIAIIDDGKIVENDRMSAILRKLHQEVFVLDLVNPLDAAPVLPDFKVRSVNASELEVEVGRGQSLNDLFSLLNERSIAVSSMRNKTNRLEELFIRLTQRKEAATDGRVG
ncbi:MAG: ABC-2 type transport system ATP-binding protein [Gammaproteobacteria bacterium]|jgi:ABC-2 type transport system ATP-binding protein